MKALLGILLVIVLLLGCNGQEPEVVIVTATPAVRTAAPTVVSGSPTPIIYDTLTPTPEMGTWEWEMPVAPIQIVNLNPTMGGVDYIDIWRSVEAGYVTQGAPNHYWLYNLRVNGVGTVDAWTDYPAITVGEYWEFIFDVSNRNHESGFGQTTHIVTPGCYLLKASGENGCFQANNPYNCSIGFYLWREGTPRQVLPRLSLTSLGRWVHYVPVYIGADGNYNTIVFEKVNYATPPNSWISIANFSFAYDPTGGHCDENTPRF